METASTTNGVPWLFIELGILTLGLALLVWFAGRLRLSAIPFYLLAGLAFGNGGLLPLRFSEEFVHAGAEIGAVLLLFMLGLEYSGDELSKGLRSGLAGGWMDLALNFPPGFVAGILFGWSPLAALLLGGVTYISSSGIVAQVLAEMGQMNDPEVPVVLSILVLEDLAMAVFLPLMAVLLLGQNFTTGLVSVMIALVAVGIVLFIAVRYGPVISRLISHQPDEIILFGVFGLVLLVAGIAQLVQVSAAIGAFLVGVAVSGPILKQTHRLLSPLRDLFAAIFFLFFGLQINPSTLPPVLLPALGLGVISSITKLGAGWWAARRSGVDLPGRLKAGIALIARGEFSILIAGLGAGLEPGLRSFAAAYVLFLAVLGPILLKITEPALSKLGSRRDQQKANE
jgi:monovalent cation:H+ antiporter-2, CPA2 family